MKIIQKDIMLNGVKIQLEDWSEHNTPEHPDLYGLVIGAYPIAVESGKYGFTLRGRKFRLSIPANEHFGYTNEDVTEDYTKLKSGEKTLEDLSRHFYNGDMDKWFFGMFEPGTDEWYEARERYGI